ncbi:MAG: threonine/serine dehydratase [Hyphomonas sp.]|uniref:threonine ammonia-lyase n=1 Tax=Hyphomonas sp. TaxID=87 RepID=UPI0017E67CF5|nr:threonine/serine dehydratase [Hyphomonas sp.]MBU3920445.1 threonine/serine dehydratase [Alphaproteobacteria bacterium]MBA3069976.1 threonine/serine dehydratase [Hyphomonas sp.]MBU4060448.1 threonine/serine dehydratase [Alphaproteobacteria bacterium]MBU4163116.1 threonine/serine dehydratase [Alphaproteobacteria bacterium]MBU4568498.1 threonine/serine dehydratase [Alphaproteobacteria bacterium]
MPDPSLLPTFEDILAAAERQRGYVRTTPVLTHAAIDAEAGARIFVKAECLQVTGSFKMRGATNRLAQIPPEGRAGGVVAFSSGNHAQGVARAARLFGMPAVIVMPSDAPQVKMDGVRADGGEIVLYDRNRESREEISNRLAAERGAVVVPSYDDRDIIAGQGTAGLEFARQMQADGEALDALICCTGGGGLITGIALAFERLSPDTRIWTAEPEAHDDWARSLEAGVILSNAPGTRSICDAILTPEPGKLTFAIGKRLLAGGLRVSDADVRGAMRLAARHLKIVAEPGGAAALAAAVRRLPDELKGKRIGVLVTGGNVDMADFLKVLLSDD